jgi:GTP cyclohydrolase I
VNFDEPNEFLPESSTGAKIVDSNCGTTYQIRHDETHVEGYKECATTRTPLATSRAQSPYTQHPTIDFDNLSWPSG